jgi:hypothetical protein
MILYVKNYIVSYKLENIKNSVNKRNKIIIQLKWKFYLFFTCAYKCNIKFNMSFF